LNDWLKADLRPPFLEHLSFRLGNQLYFIRIEDADGRVPSPGSLNGLFSIATGCKGHACIMSMKKTLGGWAPVHSGWGLFDARTGKVLNPAQLVSEELIEMTDWELRDFAVQVVRQHLKKEGFQLMSWNGNPDVNPSIWFIGKDGPEWVMVSASRYPSDPVKPTILQQVRSQLEKVAKKGSYAAVAFASTDDPFDPEAKSNGNFVRLYRGHGVHVRFTGLEPV
jgi:hypothetical protein